MRDSMYCYGCGELLDAEAPRCLYCGLLVGLEPVPCGNDVEQPELVVE